MARFKLAILEVYNLDELVTMLAMKRELCPSYFTYSLDKMSPKSYLKMMVHVQKYIRQTLLVEAPSVEVFGHP